MTFEFVFWQQIVSIHQVPMVAALAALPGVKVTYVAGAMVSERRRKLGWAAPSPGAAELALVDSIPAIEALLPRFSAQTIHVCEGFRGNGLVGAVQERLRRRGARIWVIAETVDDSGWSGIVKRAVYGCIVRRATAWADAVLAIGATTPQWFAARGFPAERVFPFTYFLDVPAVAGEPVPVMNGNRSFRIAFVGSLIHRKRLGMLIDALARLVDDLDFELIVVGMGPLEDDLRRQADERLAGRTSWMGRLPSTEVPAFLAGVDCLVLPSRFDGWGAVVSEALLVGTPAVCSDACGAAEAVRHSGAGAVFPSGDVQALADRLHQLIGQGPVRPEQRAQLAAWARGLGGPAGARYLVDIAQHRFGDAAKPAPPWRMANG